MAVHSIPVPPDAKRDARELVDQVATWPLWTLKRSWGSFEAGTTFRRATGSKGARYPVNAVCCTCPDYAEQGHICKHVRAVVLFEARLQQPAPASTYERLFPGCRDCGDLADGLDGRCSKCASDREWQARRSLAAAS